MGKPSKTGAKATAAAALAKKSRAPVVKKVSRSMRKLLAKNARKAKNRAERQAKLTSGSVPGGGVLTRNW